MRFKEKNKYKNNCDIRRKESEKGAECIFREIIAENFPNLGKKLDIQVHEAKRTSNYLNAKRPSPRYRKIVKSQ